MNAAVVKKTQESLGKVIKKPQLSEKYLIKPPFRFLHDIFTEVIRTTGFMKGLYSDGEMKSENIKEREAKMAFLQKAIDVVVLVTGEPLSVKPARVVAGQEAEKTNELLQAIALCCLNKRSSEDAVRRVLSGDKPQEREEREEEPREEEPREEEPRGAEAKSKRTKPEESRDGHKSGEAERRPKDRAEEKERREKRQDRGKERERREEKGEEQERKEKREKSKEKTRSTDRERDRKEERERDQDKHREKEREKERERRRREKEQDRSRSKPREEAPQTQAKSEEPQNISPEEPPQPAESSARIPRPSSAKGQRRRATRGSQDESDSEGDAEVKGPESSQPAAVTEAAPSHRTLRPSSARAAPPRVKRQGSHAEAERLSSAKVSALILDGKKTEEDENDEDEQFLVQEALAAAEALDAHSEAAGAGGDVAHGGLVKKILETKKHYEGSPSVTKTQTSASVQRKEQDLVQREMERLRSSVQMICRSVLPLGKIMDYLQEDMDAMSAELQHWRHENQEHAQALQEEQRLTEGALLPLKTELSELDSLIQEQQAQNCALRCSIFKNEERIHKMVTGLQHRT